MIEITRCWYDAGRWICMYQSIFTYISETVDHRTAILGRKGWEKIDLSCDGLIDTSEGLAGRCHTGDWVVELRQHGHKSSDSLSLLYIVNRFFASDEVVNWFKNTFRDLWEHDSIVDGHLSAYQTWNGKKSKAGSTPKGIVSSEGKHTWWHYPCGVIQTINHIAGHLKNMQVDQSESRDQAAQAKILNMPKHSSFTSITSTAWGPNRNIIM